MASRFSLTRKQHAVLEFLQRYFDEHQASPLIREIQIGCNIASYKSALDRLNALERKGYIRRAPNKHRGIKILRRPEPVAVDPALLEPAAAHASSLSAPSAAAPGDAGETLPVSG